MDRNSEYDDLLVKGEEFQDWISRRLLMHGVLVQYRMGKEAQRNGESWGGIEVKLDTRWPETGNLYIETGETLYPGAPKLQSGIRREDNTWLWVIGNYEGYWALAKKQLVMLYVKSNLHIVSTDTSEGMLLPVERADRISLFRWAAPEKEGKSNTER